MESLGGGPNRNHWQRNKPGTQVTLLARKWGLQGSKKISGAKGQAAETVARYLRAVEGYSHGNKIDPVVADDALIQFSGFC
jgi:RNA 3'-terminal phosphate cyclase